MASSTLACLAVVLLLGQVQCQFEFDRDRDADFDRGFDRERERERDRDFDRVQTAEGCFGKVMDIFFILDSSTSIYVNDFRQEHQFARDVVARFDVSQRNTRVGVLTFSDDITRPVMGLGRYPTKSDVLANINEQNLPYRTGITNTDLAIRYVRENTEFRQDITKVIVVVTDGGSRSPGSTQREAEMAREQGFYLYVVGIGQYLDEREWRSIASDPDDSFIYNITNFRYLDNLKFSLPPRVCALPPIIVGGSCNVNQAADVFFVAGPGGTQEAIQLIDNFVERTTDNQNLLRLSYLMGVCNDAENVRLGDVGIYCDRFAVADSFSSDSLLVLMDRMRNVARSSRENRIAKQVAVIFVDSESIRLDRFGIMNAARDAETNDNIELVIVDLGVQGFGREIQGMSSRRENLIRFSPGSLSAQRNVQKRLVDRTCDAINRDTFNFGITPN